jgi:DNA-binding transcriptional MerR regulator/ubiquinone/menaquinone biosynthesis C-methylase UbiE
VYLISELAEIVGISRTTLLYYEKLKLINGNRQSNGYRTYDNSDIQRIRLIQQLQHGGLSLKECKECIDSKIDKDMLTRRYEALGFEIIDKIRSRQLLASLLGITESKSFHVKLSSVAPDAHINWLQTQGYDEKNAQRIKWLSRDMNEHEQYMHDFFVVFNELERWGPGSREDSIKAYNSIPITPTNILEIGCGNGVSTKLLAEISDATILAIDNEQSALNRLNKSIQNTPLTDKINTTCISMTELDFPDKGFDLIWCETSIYVMGVENALIDWKRLLTDDGILMFSDLIWLSDSPSKEALDYWNAEYPDMSNLEERVRLIKKCGYKLIESFTLTEESWQNYTNPIKQRLIDVENDYQDSKAITDIRNEVSFYDNYLGMFGYQVFIIKKK